MPPADHGAYFAAALRTPMGRAGGQLASVRPDDLAAEVITRVLALVPSLARERVDEVVWGAANQAGEDNRNVARMAALLAGLPVTVPGATVNRLCGSGLEAVAAAARLVAVGEADVVIAGGSESMSRAPFVVPRPDRAYPRSMEMVDSRLGWRLVNPRMQALYPPLTLGETAEEVAARCAITRDDQDAFAVDSHLKAHAAQVQGRFDAEMVPVTLSGDAVVTTDEGVRADASVQALAKLAPVFREGGTVTAGNSSPLNDGAAAVLVVSERIVEELGITPLGRYVTTGTAGVHPDVMGIGPVPATHRALQRAGWRMEDVDLIELNEAFAAQSVAVMRELHLDDSRVNVNGGAIALGHPLGCSGARLLTTLLHAMRDRGARRGLATMCVGVGQGISVLVETP
ncbi:MAG TPA: thiolase family protein [Candidatus Dormibacteraeota bacterium]|nr:thiolase family protein [Candidatus Dormibacteraeota bacterium]